MCRSIQLTKETNETNETIFKEKREKRKRKEKKITTITELFCSRVSFSFRSCFTPPPTPLSEIIKDDLFIIMVDETYFQTMLEHAQTTCKDHPLLQTIPTEEWDLVKEAILKAEGSTNKRKGADSTVKMFEKQKRIDELPKAKEALVQCQQDELVVHETSVNTIASFWKDQLHGVHQDQVLEEALVLCSVLEQATPKRLVEFCKQDESHPDLVQELLTTPTIMREMVLQGGAKDGNYGRAYQLWKQLQDIIPEDAFQKQHLKLAMAVALEHATPRAEFDTPAVFTNPVERFRHYQQAHKNGELDPIFSYLSTWEYRMVVDCDATNEQIQWGRDFLKRYRPPQVVMDDYHWRYAISVKTDVGYRRPNWTSSPRSYQQMISGGGKCGPRAWFGRFICKAFGIPTWGVRQPAHAAGSRWTPGGWETFLGGGWSVSNWECRKGLDFRNEAHARSVANDTEYFQQVILLECMADVYKENKGLVAKEGGFVPQCLWSTLAMVQRKRLAESAEPKHFARTGDFLVHTEIEKYNERNDQVRDDNQIVVAQENGVVTIPAGAYSENHKIQSHGSFEPGCQIFLEDESSLVVYPMPTHVAERDYELACKVCNVQRPLVVFVDDNEVGQATVPYTIGEWGHTENIKVHVGPGTKIKFTRSGGHCFGLAMKGFALKPC